MDLQYLADAILLRVTDDGRGFDFTRPEQNIEDHWGLASMQERTQQVGGTFRVVTSPGSGTEIEVVAPIVGGIHT
jgi:NarL family two-component system sensor histidine kinase LiaS